MSAVHMPVHIRQDSRKDTKKRSRVFTSSDRASHRVIEKQRREALNERFLDLARQIPRLAPVSRLSKSLIVKECVEYLRAQREMRLAAACEVRKLQANYDKVVGELNTWRALYSQETIQQPRLQPMNAALHDLLKVDQEIFGTFPAGFGENGPGHEQDDYQDAISDNKGDITTSNEIFADFRPEYNTGAPSHYVEANPVFNDFLPGSEGSNIPSANFQSDHLQNNPIMQQDNVCSTPFTPNTFAGPDEGHFAYENDQTMLQHRTFIAEPNFSTLDRNQLLREDVFLPAYQPNDPSTVGINHHEIPNESAPRTKFYADTIDQPRSGYATAHTYHIHNIVA